MFLRSTYVGDKAKVFENQNLCTCYNNEYGGLNTNESQKEKYIVSCNR